MCVLLSSSNSFFLSFQILETFVSSIWGCFFSFPSTSSYVAVTGHVRNLYLKPTDDLREDRRIAVFQF